MDTVWTTSFMNGGTAILKYVTVTSMRYAPAAGWQTSTGHPVASRKTSDQKQAHPVAALPREEHIAIAA